MVKRTTRGRNWAREPSLLADALLLGGLEADKYLQCGLVYDETPFPEALTLHKAV